MGPNKGDVELKYIEQYWSIVLESSVEKAKDIPSLTAD